MGGWTVSDTPRTDAENKRTNWPSFYYDFARQLERELNESRAREAQLRAALKKTREADYSFDDSLDAYYVDKRDMAELRDCWLKALTFPAPPVVPAEDVKPMLALLQEVAALDAGEQECIASDCKEALSIFTAKHKL